MIYSKRTAQTFVGLTFARWYCGVYYRKERLFLKRHWFRAQLNLNKHMPRICLVVW